LRLRIESKDGDAITIKEQAKAGWGRWKVAKRFRSEGGCDPNAGWGRWMVAKRFRSEGGYDPEHE